MTKIAIISGDGQLPLLIGKNLINKQFDIFFIGIKGFVDSSLYKKYNFSEISITSFSKILKKLQKEKINEIIMAGKISRPSLRDINFDLTTLGLIKNYLLESKGDDKLLTTISNFFLQKGYPLFDWVSECTELFAREDNLTKVKPSKEAILNCNKGLEVFKIIGNADIGQSMIIQNQLILGIEAVEGTDELIKRCFNYIKKEDSAILIKLSKYNQNPYLDIPTVGIQTLKYLKEYNYEGIFLEIDKCLILDKVEVIKFCNFNKIFISTIVKH